jgi:hypothetical protein
VLPLIVVDNEVLAPTAAGMMTSGRCDEFVLKTLEMPCPQRRKMAASFVLKTLEMPCPQRRKMAASLPRGASHAAENTLATVASWPSKRSLERLGQVLGPWLPRAVPWSGTQRL